MSAKKKVVIPRFDIHLYINERFLFVYLVPSRVKLSYLNFPYTIYQVYAVKLSQTGY